MTNLSNAPSQDELSTSPTTSIIESLDELAGAIAASSTCTNMASSPPTRSTSSSSSNRPNANHGPGDMYEAPLNDELAESSEEDRQQVEGNKRSRERRRRHRSALSVECHPFFNGQYLAYLEDQVHKKQTEAQGADKNQEYDPQMCPPTLIAEMSFDNAHGWNGLRHVRRAKRRTSRSKSATSA